MRIAVLPVPNLGKELLPATLGVRLRNARHRGSAHFCIGEGHQAFDILQARISGQDFSLQETGDDVGEPDHASPP
jgi:hypothetical protein